MIEKTLFDTYNGKDVHLYTLANDSIKVGVLDFGGILNFIKLNTLKGEKNILVGYNSIAGYFSGKHYCGATVGRVANRIAGSRFELDGKEFSLAANENGNCLHGGTEGFDKRFFDAEIKGETLVLSLVSPDGDMGFPGKLDFRVEFTLSGRELCIKYYGKCDKDTLFSPTCHAYFNLNGGGDVLDNLLKINADRYTPADGALIPLGTTESVKGTPLDFTSLKKIGEDYDKLGGDTYDVNFCLNGSTAASARSLKCGITMELCTNLPGLQFYVGTPAAHESKFGDAGFCLEPQYYPNAINAEKFIPPILFAGKTEIYYIRYLFGFDQAEK